MGYGFFKGEYDVSYRVFTVEELNKATNLDFTGTRSYFSRKRRMAVLCYGSQVADELSQKSFEDFANAIAYLHTEFRRPIIHRDLTAKNIVMDHYGVAKLLDLSPCISLPPGESEIKDLLVGMVSLNSTTLGQALLRRSVMSTCLERFSSNS
ncbi:unnamed protein product [Fraxinus pennsylvanica]|uniref:Protein kinase domain-containing protein n=1 Tax=Fraxinus pennsylvanica TaxID=56036 RepID=A0AAD2DX65_9LAMI|nr:unnamed protein product [Fraxinus pennsylvanica]